MAIAKITLIGMYNYLDAENDNLFSLLNVPEEIDRETLINNILMVGGEFPVLWANPYFVKNAIGVWSSKNQNTFARIVETLTEDYNPLHNYDRTEEWTDDTNAESETINQRSAYDATDFQNDSKSNSSGKTGNVRKGRAYGNIGVTTSATMAREEITLRREFNIYDEITQMFIDEFCVKVY